MARPLTALVGRDTELDVLVGALDAAADGRAQGILLAGDAGVGKTRLLTEMAGAARERGCLTLVGHCIDFGDAGLPYLPFTEIVGRMAEVQPDLLTDLLADAPPLARLLPQRRRSPDGPDDAEPVDRAALFEAVLEGLTALSRRTPVLLVIEDAHWADKASRDVIGFLLTRLGSQRITFVVSYRTDDLHRRHPLRPVVAGWARIPGVERLHLSPLRPDDVRALIDLLHPHALSEVERQAVVDRAGGIPFFVEQLVSGGAGVLPGDLADVLLVRLDQLSDDARTVVRAAAVAGRQVPHPMLAAVTGLGDTDLESALREAADAHILVAHGTASYEFRHALLAEAVYDDLLPGERLRLHAAYAGALQQTGTVTAAELARHARGSLDMATAFDASVRAGADAMTLAAPWEAMRHYEAALELQAHAPPSALAAGGLADLLVAAADAMTAAGYPHRAVALLQPAAASLPADTPPEAGARVLLSLARAALSTESDEAAFAATSEALRLVPAEPPTPDRARIAALHAHTAAALGRHSEAQRWAEEAAELASRVGAADAAADAATTMAVLRRRAGDPDAAVTVLQGVLAEALDAGDLTAELRSRYSLGSVQFERGDVPAALAEFRRAVDRAASAGRPWAPHGLESRVLAGLLEYLSGQWDASLRTLSLAGQPPSPMAEALLAATTLWVRAGRGDTSALELVPTLMPWARRDGMAAVQLTAAIDLHLAAGDPAAALALRERLVADLADLWQDEFFPAQVRLSAVGISALTASLDDVPHASRGQVLDRGDGLADLGRAAAARMVTPLGAEARAWLARLEAEHARLRWTAGVDAPGADELTTRWADAVEAFGFGNVLEQARSRVRLAAVLRAAGDVPAAQEQADRARIVARRLGAAPVLHELRTLALSGPLRRAATTGVLTAREREVLDLLAEGSSNRDVARRLFISEKTVSVHVSNILAKLHAGSRTEAAAIARREGLVS